MMRTIGIVLAAALVLGITSAPEAARPQAVYRARLSPQNEVPPVTSAASGMAEIRVHRNGIRMDITLTVSRIRDVTVAHLHMAPPGENGPAVALLYAPADPGGVERGLISSRTLTRGDLTGPLAGMPLSALVEEIDAGNIYVNVHTVGYTAGELRGPVTRAGGHR